MSANDWKRSGKRNKLSKTTIANLMRLPNLPPRKFAEKVSQASQTLRTQSAKTTAYRKAMILKPPKDSRVKADDAAYDVQRVCAERSIPLLCAVVNDGAQMVVAATHFDYGGDLSEAEVRWIDAQVGAQLSAKSVSFKKSERPLVYTLNPTPGSGLPGAGAAPPT